VELSQRARVRSGDHDEFGVLFEEHARAVYNHAFRLTGNWSAAEEVVSLTFLEAWRLRGTVRPEGGSLLPWLLGIALNVARNVSRAARRQQAAMSRLPKAQDVPDFADDLAGRLDDAERLEKIHAVLNGLRRTERDGAPDDRTPPGRRPARPAWPARYAPGPGIAAARSWSRGPSSQRRRWPSRPPSP
jgi:RNA polymerase sigma factor (sigma-70 family)